MAEIEMHADPLYLGEINPEVFTGDLPSKKQSDYARQQNCNSLQLSLSDSKSHY